MTTLEIVLILILWVILGLFICYKRDWYPEKDYNDMPSGVRITFATVLAPLNFIVVFTQMFFLNKWDNE